MRIFNKLIILLFISCLAGNLLAQDCVLTTACGDDVIADWGLANGVTYVCEGEPFEVTVNDQTTMTDIDEIIWIWGDGETTTASDFSNQFHTYNLSGDGCNGPNQEVYQITLEITRTCAEGTSCHFQTAPVAVRYKPKARFEMEKEVCVNTPVSFENNSCNGDTYSWAFGDGSTSNLAVPNPHTYLNPGTYEVTLTVSNECGDDEEIKEITVVEPPVAGFIMDPNPPGCIPFEVFFENTSQNVLGNCVANYEWSVSPLTGWYYKDEIVGNDTTIYNQNTWDTQIEFTDTGTYIVNLLIENVCGPAMWSETIQVFESPDISLNNPGFKCLENGSVTIDFNNTLVNYSGTNQGISWLFTNQDGVTVATSNQNNPSITFTEGGTITATVTIDGGLCGEDSDEEVFTIQAPGVADLSDNPTTICNTDSPIQLNPSGVTWSGSPYVSSSGLLDPTNASGTLNLTYTPPDDCVTLSTMSITILPGPIVDIEDINPECDEVTISHTTLISGTYGTVNWEHILPDGTIQETFTQSTAPTITYSGAGEHLLVVNLSDTGCGTSTDTSVIEIQSIDAIVIEPLATPLCSTSSPDTIIFSPLGGTWSGPGVSIDGIFDPSIPDTGVPITLTYTYGEGVCSSSESIIVEVIASAPVNVEDDIVICTDSDPYALIFDPIGGSWTGTGISPEGVFDPSGLTPGNYEVTYLFGDANGCLITQVSNITIEGLPTIEMDDQITFCETSDDLSLPTNLAMLNLNPGDGMITWSGPGIVNASEGIFNSFQAGASGVGTYTIYLNYMLVDCEIQDSLEIEIIPIQSADAGPDDTLCISDQSYTLSGSPSGGQWQEVGGAGNGLDSSTGELNLELAGGGIHTYRYVFAAGTSCEVEDEVMIEIIDLTSVNAGNDFEICEGTATFQLTGNSPAGGEWTGPGIIDASGTFDPSLLQPDSTYIVTYCIEDQTIACSACDERTIRINALPVAGFQINGTNCVGEELNIENLSTNACIYAWNFGDPTSGLANFSSLENPTHVYNTIGEYTITLITESCENCLDTFTYNITVEEPPFASFTQDVDEGCAVLEVNFSNESFGSNLSYLWDFGNGQTSTAASPGLISFEQGNFDTTYQISLAVTNGCGTVEYHDSVTVFPLPIVIFGTNVDDGCSPLEIEFSNISLGNPETYEWYIDGVLLGSDSIFQNQIFTTSDTAITTYEITLIANNFCGSDTLSNEIIVYPPDVDAFLSVDTTSGCQPLTVNFSNFSTPGATISWDFGDGNGSFETNPVYTFDSAGIFTVYQYASNCGTDTDSIVIEVLPAPEVSFIHEPFVCDGQPIEFTNTSIGLNGSEWDFGDGNTSLLDSPTHVFDGAGEYTVTLTGYSNLNNCPASFESVVTVLGNPEISFIPSTLDGCAPLSIDFNNTSIGAEYYEWDFGNGEVSSDENPQNQIFNDPGTYEVTLIGTDLFGCFSDTSIINIIVHEIPNSDFFTNEEEYCSGVDLIETTNTSEGANQYYWTFGNGAVIEEFQPSQLVQDTGNLDIILIAENGFGCKDTTVNEVYILGTPIALAPVSEFDGCVELGVQFGNASQFADEFFWDFGENNNTSTDLAPFYTYTSSGDYAATMIAMNSNGCPSDTFTFEITANPLPESDFTLSLNEVCGFADTIFMTNNSNGATDYEWDFENGMSSTLFEPFAIYSDTGSYTVSLVSTNQFGCKDTTFQNLEILGQPEADILATTAEGCQPALFDFVNNSNYSDSFEWDFGDGNINSTISNPQHLYTQDGTYELILNAHNTNGCPSDQDTLMITVHPKPISDFELSELLVCGLPDTIQTTNFSQGANDYLWSFGNGTSSTLTTPFIVYQTPDDYTVSLIVTNGFGCKDTLEQEVSINLQPNAAFGPGQYIGCEPDTINFINNTVNADSWIWDFGDGNISTDLNPSHPYPEAGNYDVQLIAEYNQSCFDTLTVLNAVSILPSPIAAFTYTDSMDGKLQFFNQSIDALFYEWDLGNGDFSEETSPFYEYTYNGNWEVILTAIHQNGCTDMDTMSVSPEIFFGLYLPNAMSPESGEGDVRLFKPAGIGIKSYTVEVYSPWGQLLWQNSRLDGESPKGSWDGSFKGKIVPQGAYVWKAEAEFINGIRQVKTGVVNLLR